MAWSPDSKRVAFLSDAAKPGQLQLYVTDAAGGPARRLTGVKGFLATPGWSPDGRTIALLFTENATRAAGPLVAATPQTGEIVEAVTEQRLALVDVSSGLVRQISPADMYVYEYDWSPDGQQFVVTAAPGNGDANWYVAQIYTISAAGGELTSIYKPTLQVANPAWSPDGTSVAFIAGLMSDEPAIGGDIFIVGKGGGEARNLTPEMKASASWLTWTPEKKILFGEYIEGDAGIATVDPGSGRIEQRVSRRWASDRRGLGHRLCRSRTTGRRPPSSAVRSACRRRSGRAPSASGSRSPVAIPGSQPAWGDARSIHWKSDGYDVQGWLIYPRRCRRGQEVSDGRQRPRRSGIGRTPGMARSKRV